MGYNGIMFTADMHLRDSVPVCRTDDFIKAQWNKFEQIQVFADQNNLCWIDAGDVFEKAQPSLFFVNKVMLRMHTPIYGSIMGNHDAPAHNVKRRDESAWGCLYAAAKIENQLDMHLLHVSVGSPYLNTETTVHVYGTNYGQELPIAFENKDVFNILVIHDMVYASVKDQIPNAPGTIARKLLRDNPQFDIIVSGHNHKSFHVHLGDRHLLNIGSMTRQAADQIDHIPRIAYWTPKEGVKWHELKHTEDVITREHIDKKEQKEEELNAFVESLQRIDEVSLSFEDNVNRIIQETKPEKPVENKVREAML